MNPQKFLGDVQAVLASQTQIGDGQIKPVRLGGADRVPAGRAGGDGKSHRRQAHLDQLQQSFFVVDYENVLLFHESSGPLCDYGLVGSVVVGGTTVDGGRIGRTLSRIS